MNISLGIIETKGMVAAMDAADEMLKQAYVEIASVGKAGSGLVAVVFSGDLSNVRAAFDIGVRAAERSGELVAATVIPKPFPDLRKIIKY